MPAVKKSFENKILEVRERLFVVVAHPKDFGITKKKQAVLSTHAINTFNEFMSNSSLLPIYRNKQPISNNTQHSAALLLFRTNNAITHCNNLSGAK